MKTSFCWNRRHSFFREEDWRRCVDFWLGWTSEKPLWSKRLDSKTWDYSTHWLIFKVKWVPMMHWPGFLIIVSYHFVSSDASNSGRRAPYSSLHWGQTKKVRALLKKIQHLQQKLKLRFSLQFVHHFLQKYQHTVRISIVFVWSMDIKAWSLSFCMRIASAHNLPSTLQHFGYEPELLTCWFISANTVVDVSFNQLFCQPLIFHHCKLQKNCSC